MTVKQKSLQIEVSNFGPITKGKVCTKPLTIFTGPSNTGKSYLAKLLYSALKSPANYSLFDEYPFIKEQELRKELGTKGIEDILTHRETFFKILESCVDLQKTQDFFNEYFNFYFKRWANQIYRVLGPTDNLVSYSKSQNDLEIVLNNIVHLKSANDALILKDDDGFSAFIESLSKTIREDICMDGNFTREVFPEMSKDFNENKRIFNQSLIIFLRKLNRKIMFFYCKHEQVHLPFLDSVFYFPSARTGLIQTHRLIAAKAVRDLAGSYNKASKLTHSDISDFLEEIITIDINKKQEDEEILKIVNDIETNILKGQIEVILDETGYPDFVFKEGNFQCGMLNASSAVTDIAPIVLFLKYDLVKSGDTLIIDEPEIHLHPRAQKDMARILVALVKVGVNIIITTHSNTLVRQISNYRMAEKIPEKKRKAIMKDEYNLTLSEDELAVYNFKKEKDDVTVEKVPFDLEDGISIEDHNDVSTELYDETIDIYDESPKDESKPSA